MKILVVGWYGTETIGDRAILAGLIQLFTTIYGDVHVTLASLNPFFSERTIKEDYSSYVKISSGKLEFTIIDSTNFKHLDRAINNNELVVMGGGPLMDLSELHMVDYAFKKAKKIKKKTAILGCGVGPLFQKKFKKTVLSIVKYSDVIVLRDIASLNNLKQIASELFINFDGNINVTVGFDPAVHYAHAINSLIPLNNQDYIAVNLRAYPIGYSEGLSHDKINSYLMQFIDKLSDRFSNQEIRLIPMHYFETGDDDRYFLNDIKFLKDYKNISVQNKPLSLEETVTEYKNANFNIGMRFHSVVLQTIVSGKNYVLDYTQPKVGKISGFLDDIDLDKFYLNRYISLQEGLEVDIDIFFETRFEQFHYENDLISQSINKYESVLELLK